jgi:hypothetical protein
LPISLTNTILISAFLLVAVVMVVVGNVGTGLWVGFLAVMMIGVALYARRPDSRDITRLNAIEYRDERDKSLATEGFAAVGVAALILGMGVILTLTVLERLSWLVVGFYLVLLVVWAAANSRAVRRR